MCFLVLAVKPYAFQFWGKKVSFSVLNEKTYVSGFPPNSICFSVLTLIPYAFEI